MKCPKTGPEKGSLPGVLGVKRVGGVPTAFPADQVAPEENLLRVVYDKRPLELQVAGVGGWQERAGGAGCQPRHAAYPALPRNPPIPPQWESFDELRARVEREWAALPPAADVLAPALRAKRAEVAARLGVQGQVRD